MHVAVVILNYNGRKYLEKFLPTLIQYSPEASIFVADNCSTDDSIQYLETLNSVHIIKLQENYGYAGGYNEALKQIDAEYYILVNSDIEVTPNWIPPLIQFLEFNNSYASVQPKILDYNRKDHFEYAGAAGGFIDSLGYPFCRGRIFDSLETDRHQYDQLSDIFWSSGACFAIRSKLFHKLGGFDFSFFAHMEEIDLCWRIKSSGLKIAFIPESIVYHVGGGTLSKQSPTKSYLNFRNGIWLLLKNLPKHQLIYKIPARVLMDWLAAVLLWKKESFRHFLSVFKAHYHAFKTAKKYLINRKRSNPTLAGQKTKIIAFSAMILHKQRFSDL